MRALSILSTVVLFTACNLEGDYPMDARFPHQTEIENGNSTNIDIEKLGVNLIQLP